MQPSAQPPSPRNFPTDSPPLINADQQQVLEQVPPERSSNVQSPVVYHISQYLENGQKQVPSLIFSFLEIFELLRLKTTCKDFRSFVQDYFEHLQFLDLSPYFGYTISESRLLEPSFSNGRSFFHVFQELCPNRTNLSLAYSTQLTCSALKHFLLPDNWSDQLIGLNLYYCTKLKRTDLCELLQSHAPNLIDLNISMLHKLTPADVQYILHALKNLKRISLQGSLKLPSISDPATAIQPEIDVLEKLENEILQRCFGELLFIDCRNCTLLETREFWQPSNDHDSNNQKMYGIILRGSTWILGPKHVGPKDVQLILCLYQDCETGNDKSSHYCKKCGRRLFLLDYLTKPSSLYVNHFSEAKTQTASEIRTISPSIQ